MANESGGKTPKKNTKYYERSQYVIENTWCVLKTNPKRTQNELQIECSMRALNTEFELFEATRVPVGVLRLQRPAAAHEPATLSRGERVSGSGAFISRSVTGEGSVHRDPAPPCRDRLADQASLNHAAIRDGLERHGECMARLRRVSGTRPVGNGTNPSPGPRRLMTAPSRSTLTPGRGL